MSRVWRSSIVSATRRHDVQVFIYAFDLIELDGEDLRSEPLIVRKATLASLLSRTREGIRLNEHVEHADGVDRDTSARSAWRTCQRGAFGLSGIERGLM